MKPSREKFLLPGRRSALLHYLLFLMSVFFMQPSAEAQQDLVQAEPWFEMYAGGRSVTTVEGTRFFIVQFRDAGCIEKWRKKIVRPLGVLTAVIRHSDTAFSFFEGACMEKWVPAGDAWKLSPTLWEMQNGSSARKVGKLTFSIVCENLGAFLDDLRREEVQADVLSLHRESGAAVIECDSATFFAQVLTHPALLFADLHHAAGSDVLVNGFFRNINALNRMDYYWPSLNGRGITIGIKEKLPDVTDIDLKRRVQPSVIADPQNDNHATVVATLAGGAGNSFISGKGVAWNCNFFPSSFSNLFPDSTQLLMDKNVTVQNHAYGTVIQPFYGAEAQAYDLQAVRYSNLLHVFSSGNRGQESATTGTYANLRGFGNLTGNFKMAKNVLTVAAVDTSGRPAPFSSSGPLYDGRLGPQITALGPNGTSEATALVSGAAAVLQQLYKDSTNQVSAPASLIKAVLFTGADDIGAPGIDYRTGYGLLNLFRSTRLMQQRQFDSGQLSPSEVWAKTIVLPAQASQLKITLCWTDTSALFNTYRALVNDLDLEVTALASGAVYKPWCLSTYPSADSLRALPVRKRDSLNTSEQVSIRLPEAGTYQVKVIARALATSSNQSFHIAWSIDTLNTFRFTNPVRPEDINREENPVLPIRWETALADTNATGTLLVSLDSGMHWRELSTNVPLSQRSFAWSVPDTVTLAQLRMDCPFGSFYSEKFVIAPLTSVRVDYLCADSMRLSWQKHPLAVAYRLFNLRDSAYIGAFATIADTFIVLSRNVHSEQVFAVEPVTSSGISITRSYAINVLNQGVDCFYQALVAETAGDRVKLTLSLSYLSDTDSLVYYMVSASGSPLKRLGMLLPGNGPGGYTVYDNEPSSGLNYYRVFIYTGGEIVYTEIVSILHNGKQPVWVYPNPVRRGQRLNVLVNESAADGILQLHDAAGRLLGSFPFNVAAGINTAAFAPGLYFYRMIGTDGRNLTSGKIIIQ